MKSILLVLLGCLIISLAHTVAWGESTWVPLDGDTELREPTLDILKADESETLIRVRLFGFNSTTITHEDIVFQDLTLPGCGNMREVGRPRLPVISKTIAIPGGANCSVEILDTDWVSLPDYHVYPSQELSSPDNETAAFQMEEAVYTSDALFPASAVELTNPGVWRDLNVAALRIHPLRHHPASGEIEVLREFTVRIDHGSSGERGDFLSASSRIDTSADRVYRGMVLNYEALNCEVAAADGDRSGEYDMLVIAHPSLMGCNWANFLNHKSSQGLNVELANLNWMTPTAEGIRSYIQSEYLNNNIRYVLLAGNTSQIPHYSGFGFYSDFYYGCLQDDDDYPEIAVGRFCPEAGYLVVDINAMIQKTIQYEVASGDWTEEVLLIAAQDNDGQWPDLDFRSQIDAIRNQNYDALDPLFTQLNGEDGDTNSDIDREIEEGKRVVAYNGHGWMSNWRKWNSSLQYFTTSDVQQLYNGTKNPVVLSMACETGGSFGREFMYTTQRAVAFLGSKENTDFFASGVYAKEWFRQIFSLDIGSIGWASNCAAVKAINEEGAFGINDARSYLWYGDPSLLVRDGVHEEPDPLIPVQIYPYDSQVFYTYQDSLTLRWSEIIDNPNLSGYRVQVANINDFSNPEIDEILGASTTEYMGSHVQTCMKYWRVCARYNDVDGAWSTTRAVQYTSSKPAVYRPLYNAVFVNYSPITFTWDNMGNAESYEFQVAEDELFNTELVRDAVVYNFERNLNYPDRVDHQWAPISGMMGEYWWRVRIHDPDLDRSGRSYIWSTPRNINMLTGPPSCPVLYIQDGPDFVEENPLLTVCEQSGYRDVVTDYYHLPELTVPRDGVLNFQLRELENEITFLEEIALIAVDHPDDTSVCCSVNGDIFTISEILAPLSAHDETGRDVLAAVLARDDVYFEDENAGSLTLDFPTLDGTMVFCFRGGGKPPCLHESVPDGPRRASVPVPEQSVFRAEYMTLEGAWAEIAPIPTRKNANWETVTLAPELTAGRDVTRIRLSWRDGFSSDAVQQFVPATEAPLARLLPVWKGRFTDASGISRDVDPALEGVLEMCLGEIYDFAFHVESVPEGMSRDYIIRARGRYQPDYEVYTQLRPNKLTLYGNFPNPFNPTTAIKFDLPQAGQVVLKVYDGAGRLVRVLCNEQREVGQHSIIWDGRNSDGNTIASGIYFYNLEAGGQIETRKMIMLK